MSIDHLNGTRFAILVMGKDAHEKDDWAVFAGVARVNDGVLSFEHDGGVHVQIQSEWLARILPVDVEVKGIFLGAEHYLPLTLGPLPEGESAESYISTGLTWPP